MLLLPTNDSSVPTGNPFTWMSSLFLLNLSPAKEGPGALIFTSVFVLPLLHFSEGPAALWLHWRWVART